MFSSKDSWSVGFYLHFQVSGVCFLHVLCGDELDSFQEPIMCDTSYGGVCSPRRAYV